MEPVLATSSSYLSAEFCTGEGQDERADKRIRPRAPTPVPGAGLAHCSGIYSLAMHDAAYHYHRSFVPGPGFSRVCGTSFLDPAAGYGSFGRHIGIPEMWGGAPQTIWLTVLRVHQKTIVPASTTYTVHQSSLLSDLRYDLRKMVWEYYFEHTVSARTGSGEELRAMKSSKPPSLLSVCHSICREATGTFCAYSQRRFDLVGEEALRACTLSTFPRQLGNYYRSSFDFITRVLFNCPIVRTAIVFIWKASATLAKMPSLRRLYISFGTVSQHVWSSATVKDVNDSRYLDRCRCLEKSLQTALQSIRQVKSICLLFKWKYLKYDGQNKSFLWGTLVHRQWSDHKLTSDVNTITEHFTTENHVGKFCPRLDHSVKCDNCGSTMSRRRRIEYPRWQAIDSFCWG